MSTDRELLDLAAKAAGLLNEALPERGLLKANGMYWNPLTDDGDALRLAVKLRLTVAVRDHEVEIFDEGGCLVSQAVPPIFNGDRPTGDYEDPQDYARRAIVRAAAALAQG